MKVKMKESKEPIAGIVSGNSYLNLCAHCGECLKQIVTTPYKYNVVLHYRNKKGDIVEWKPTK